MQKHNFFVKQFFFQDEVEILTFFDGDDDFGDDDDDEDEYSCNSVNFQARTSRFCMEVDLDNGNIYFYAKHQVKSKKIP